MDRQTGIQLCGKRGYNFFCRIRSLRFKGLRGDASRILYYFPFRPVCFSISQRGGGDINCASAVSRATLVLLRYTFSNSFPIPSAYKHASIWPVPVVFSPFTARHPACKYYPETFFTRNARNIGILFQSPSATAAPALFQPRPTGWKLFVGVCKTRGEFFPGPVTECWKHQRVGDLRVMPTFLHLQFGRKENEEFVGLTFLQLQFYAI